ncbi:putative Type 1 galactoside alpha-(1,2)-fucosyltransferase [Lupinus albus]|uniref:Fucosyltransferase n=1 Tax=Lupinus albus TaxID=3870 RepID=A0A6A4QPI2_LUPAL|nr:putative Type 1 galactoside alpha-(1,2)-fucosyltransferase [Lupinus albus]
MYSANADGKDKNAPSTSPSNVSTPHTPNPDDKGKDALKTSPPNISTPHTANPDDKDKNASSTSPPNLSTSHTANPNEKDKNASLISPTNVSTPHSANPDDKDKNGSSTSSPNVSTPPTANPVDKDKNVSSTSPPNVSTPHTGNPVDKDKNASTTSPPNDSIHDEKDKLIDGLLASGFDEASCTSRFQSHLFRKPSHHKPSQYLISKLRHYEELHRKCGPNSRGFRRNMKVLQSKKKGAVGICKYLVWTPANGLGNRMISLAATFLYAIFADRVLLVRFHNDMRGLFCEPFLNSTWLLPKDSPFWGEKNVETYKTMLKMDKASHSKRALPSTLFINLQHTRDDLEKFFHCDHNQDLLRNITLLILQSDQYFVPYLFMNPYFNSEINKMFPEKDAIFHHLARYLFHPSNEAWGLISRFYQTYLASANEKIGLQIRVFSPTTTPMQAIMDLVLNCTISNNLLPALDTQNLVSYSKNQTVKVVLVASLFPEYGENLRAMYLTKPSVSGELIGVYQPSHEKQQKFYNNMHNIKAWSEMYLLSLSDVLVTTSLSTFGYVAQGLGGLKPWLLYRLTNNETHFPACVRDFSIEPCNHIPPKHFCNGKPIQNFSSSFPYLRECLDFSFGVKLGNTSST